MNGFQESPTFDVVPIVNPTISIEKKRCIGCKQEKHLLEFGPEKGSKCGRRSRCRECNKKYRRELYQMNVQGIGPKIRKQTIPVDKKCTKCGKVKVLSGFHLEKRSYDGRTSICILCGNKKRLVFDRQRRKNPEVREYNRITASKYLKNNKTKCIKSVTEWRRINPTKVKQYRKTAHENKKENAQYKICNSIRGRINSTLKGGKNRQHWEDLVGYTIGQLKKHLEKQFKPGMSWENYGFRWHIDHDIPISAFNFQLYTDIDFKKCWALKNLKPLSAKENLQKHASLRKPFQPSLLIQ